MKLLFLTCLSLSAVIFCSDNSSPSNIPLKKSCPRSNISINDVINSTITPLFYFTQCLPLKAYSCSNFKADLAILRNNKKFDTSESEKLRRYFKNHIELYHRIDKSCFEWKNGFLLSTVGFIGAIVTGFTYLEKLSCPYKSSCTKRMLNTVFSISTLIFLSGLQTLRSNWSRETTRRNNVKKTIEKYTLSQQALQEFDSKYFNQLQ